MTRRVTTPALVAHHLRSRSGGGLTVAALVLVLSLLATAAPIALGVLADAALRDRLASLGALDRDVESATAGFPQIGPGDADLPPATQEVWGGFVEAVEAVRASAEPALEELLAPARTVALDKDNVVAEDPRTLALSLAFDPDVDRQVQLVDGRMPEPATPVQDDSGAETGVRIEVVMSAASAEQMAWPIGESRTIGIPDFPADMVLTGTFDAIDPADGYWQHVPSVLEPNIFDDGNAPRKVTGTAYANAASLPYASALLGTQSTLVWYPLDTARIDADSAAETAAALRKFTAVSQPVGTSAGGIGILSIRFSADVTATIELALAQEAATAGVIAMVIAGPVGVAAAVLILGCRLILERRRPSLRLLSARGSSTGQLRGMLGLEGVFVGIVPAVLGAAIAAVGGMLLFGSSIGVVSVVPALIIGLAPPVILAVFAPSAAERQARADLGRRGSRSRAITEGVVLVLAAAAVALLFLRGYGVGGIDPLRAATPLLLALVACLVTLRVYPIPLRWIFTRARRSAGITDFLGSARALREPSIGLTPVLALVVGVSVAVSSGVLLSALQGGVAEAAQAQIGADMRVTGGSFTLEQLDQVRAIDGVAAATGISGAENASLDVNGVKRATSVFVVDAADLRAVQGDGPGMLPPGASLEPTDGPMPIAVAAATAEFIDGSDEIRVNAVDARVAGVSTGPSPIGSRENWVAIDSSYAEDVLGRDPSDRTLLLSLDGTAAAPDVEASLRTLLGSGIRVDTPDEIRAGIESGPAVQGVRYALLAATAVAALLSALAIVMTLTLAAGPRARVLALLRTLGARPRIGTSLALWEVGPPAIAAVIAGTVFGALVPLVVLAGVDLRSFTGSTIQPGYRVDAATLALTLGGFVLLAVLLTAIALLVSRRVRAASALRTVEEG
ncbi:putative ABC transport system permease protein [Microbacterium sp. cf046]|uniref:FtsX-like permease family protein n=1 Tax=Microbacterium sp. cf046 TaxID=1761803 RepID=UPI0008E3BB66|nr:FtsX-like permease family protein [Microbacterium sp. cf046]SFS13267.1 putative ABC transport system permease protein [Microbacterium sp. cf046]